MKKKTMKISSVFKAQVFIVTIVLVLTNAASAETGISLSEHIYGVHNWASDLDQVLKNGRGFYTVDMVISEIWTNDSNYRNGYLNTVKTASEQGFTVIMRVDYQSNQVMPPEDDWSALATYSLRLKDIVTTLGPYCQIWIMGNEMLAGYANVIPKEWYTTCFSYPDTGCYDSIHSVQNDAIVCFGGLGGWPGYESEPDSGINYLDYFCKNCSGKVDAFSVHSYGGPANQALGGDLDDPRTSDIGSFGAYKAFCNVIYDNFGRDKPVYITESNTYWWIGGTPPHSMDSYQAGWIQKAYQAIDQWNQANDLKVHALCWYSYAHYGVCDGNSGDFWHNAIQPERCPSDPELDQAREDYQWVTLNTDYKWGTTKDGFLKVQAENYDNDVLWGDTIATGIEGNDYHDTDAGNIGGAYRPDDVDIAEIEDTVYIGWTEPGEWLQYTILGGGRSSHYTIRLRYAREVAGSGTCHITVDGVNVTDTVSCPSTGGWETFTEIISKPFVFNEGVHDVKLVFEGQYLNVDWFQFEPMPKTSGCSSWKFY